MSIHQTYSFVALIPMMALHPCFSPLLSSLISVSQIEHIQRSLAEQHKSNQIKKGPLLKNLHTNFIMTVGVIGCSKWQEKSNDITSSDACRLPCSCLRSKYAFTFCKSDSSWDSVSCRLCCFISAANLNERQFIGMV